MKKYTIFALSLASGLILAACSLLDYDPMGYDEEMRDRIPIKLGGEPYEFIYAQGKSLTTLRHHHETLRTITLERFDMSEESDQETYWVDCKRNIATKVETVHKDGSRKPVSSRKFPYPDYRAYSQAQIDDLVRQQAKTFAQWNVQGEFLDIVCKR